MVDWAKRHHTATALGMNSPFACRGGHTSSRCRWCAGSDQKGDRALDRIGYRFHVSTLRHQN